MPNHGKVYQKTLDYLFGQLPMFQRIGQAAFKKDLTNIRALCRHLGEPQTKFPSVHIAGTNGKGSSAHMLAAIFQAAGYKTGLYTSPHYRDFRERIKVNGRMILKKEVIEFVLWNKGFFDSLKPSFFEITVAMAFDIFARRKVDIAIIETGLGGRLDSTNIIRPEVSLITNISYDHQAFLGDTLPEIASEKAGIIKEGVPVVISERQPKVEQVFIEVAALNNAPLHFATDQLTVDTLASGFGGTQYRVMKNGAVWLDDLDTEVFGTFQSRNLAGVLQSICLLQESGWPIDEKAIRNGLARLKSLTSYTGRWQVISKDPLTICDSGHNEAGWQQVTQQLARLDYKSLHFVLGTVNDKSPEKMIRLLPKTARYYLARPDIPRGLDVKVLHQATMAAGLDARPYPSVSAALKAAQKAAGPGDLVFVGGSTFVVAEVV